MITSTAILGERPCEAITYCQKKNDTIGWCCCGDKPCNQDGDSCIKQCRADKVCCDHMH